MSCKTTPSVQLREEVEFCILLIISVVTHKVTITYKHIPALEYSVRMISTYNHFLLQEWIWWSIIIFLQQKLLQQIKVVKVKDKKKT